MSTTQTPAPTNERWLIASLIADRDALRAQREAEVAS